MLSHSINKNLLNTWVCSLHEHKTKFASILQISKVSTNIMPVIILWHLQNKWYMAAIFLIMRARDQQQLTLKFKIRLQTA
jgi:hypothetical protein